MKFGGTSMGSAERIKVAAGICAAQRKKRPVVVVVSAMSKVTDLLLATLRAAELGETDTVGANIAKLRQDHLAACVGLLPESHVPRAIEGIEALIAEFQRVASGILMLSERPPRSVDEAVAVGERLSALLIASYLDVTGVPSVDVNGGDVVVTDAVFGNATPVMDATRIKAQANLN